MGQKCLLSSSLSWPPSPSPSPRSTGQSPVRPAGPPLALTPLAVSRLTPRTGPGLRLSPSATSKALPAIPTVPDSSRRQAQRATRTWHLSEEVSCLWPVFKFLLSTTGSLGMICTKRVLGNGYQEELYLLVAFTAVAVAVLYLPTTNTTACYSSTARDSWPLLRTAHQGLLQSVSTILRHDTYMQ